MPLWTCLSFPSDFSLNVSHIVSTVSLAQCQFPIGSLSEKSAHSVGCASHCLDICHTDWHGCNVYTGPVRCEADVLVTPSRSSSTSSLTLFVASDSFSVLSTPDAEAIQACAMFLCKQTNSTSQEVVCDTLWSAASNDGSVQLIELRGSFSPNGTVIPMAAVDEMELLQPSKTPFYMHPQPTLRVELDESQKLYSAALYTQYQWKSSEVAVYDTRTHSLKKH